MKKPIAATLLIMTLLPVSSALAQSSAESLRVGSTSPGAPAADTAPYLSHNEQGRALSRGLAPVPRPAANPTGSLEPQEPSWISRLASRFWSILLGGPGPG